MQNSSRDYISFKNIIKEYGVVKALRDVSFTIGKGEIHTLLGENGAGKSTLVKILKGEEVPTSGEIYVAGEKIPKFTPNTAHDIGISMVHQELAIFENMTVAENIFPNSIFKTKNGGVDKEKLFGKTELAIKSMDLDIKPGDKLDALNLANQQMVEILRCISNGQKIIILDEPTSGLNSQETYKLMNAIKELRNKGITIIYISHRIGEILEISDFVTIMRDGEYICTFDNDETLTEDKLISNMVGKELSCSLYFHKEYYDASGNDVILDVQNFTKQNSIQDVNFTLRKGETVGVFGLEGSGVKAFSKMLYGLESKDSGTMTFKGKVMDKINPTTMVNNKILYLNTNRKKAGLLLNSSAVDNMLMPVIKEMSKFGFIKNNELAAHTQKYIDLFSTKIPSVFAKPKNLSGGNQQKIMLSVCLGTEPECLIINEPTRGIDVGAKVEIHRFLETVVNNDIGLVVFSSELPELLALCDRIIVMNENRISGEVCSEMNEEAIMKLAAGQTDAN